LWEGWVFSMPQYAYFKPFENWESQFPNGTLQLFEDKVHVLEEEKKRRKMLLPDDKKNLNTTTKPNQGEQIGFDF
jgi:hypothetical protein